MPTDEFLLGRWGRAKWTSWLELWRGFDSCKLVEGWGPHMVVTPLAMWTWRLLIGQQTRKRPRSEWVSTTQREEKAQGERTNARLWLLFCFFFDGAIVTLWNLKMRFSELFFGVNAILCWLYLMVSDSVGLGIFYSSCHPWIW